MEKTAEAFRTISEVADWLEIPTHVLRFWESQFSQIKPVKRAGGRRYYRPKDMLLIGGIKKLLHEDGESIKAAKKILNKRGVKYVAALSETPSFMKDRNDQAAARPSDDAPNIAAIEDVNVSAERLIETSTKVIPLPLPKTEPSPLPASQKRSVGRKTLPSPNGDARQASLFDDYEPSLNFWADTEADNSPRSEPVTAPLNIAPNFGAIKHHIRQMPPLSKTQKTDLAPLMQRMTAILGTYGKRHNTP
jgi:DNA-binding transcriptional MerR regulator